MQIRETSSQLPQGSQQGSPPPALPPSPSPPTIHAQGKIDKKGQLPNLQKNKEINQVHVFLMLLPPEVVVTIVKTKLTWWLSR